jgi:hypothetical protein
MKSVKKSKPRIDLSPLMHRLLLAEAAKRGIRPNALVENLIEEASSPEAKALVGMNLEEKIDPGNPQIAEDAKLPFALSPLPISESLNSEEKIVLEHLQANRTYREIQELEKGKSNVTKSKVQSMVQKFIGMGIYQGGKRGPKKQRV